MAGNIMMPWRRGSTMKEHMWAALPRAASIVLSEFLKIILSFSSLNFIYGLDIILKKDRY